jgi:hypothetical protein
MDRLGFGDNKIPNVRPGQTVYFWSVLLPSGEELQIVTQRPIPTDVCDDINSREILAAQIYPRRLDANV